MIRRKDIILFFIWPIFLLHSACTVNWTTAITYGEINATNFQKTTDIEIRSGLIIVPVVIDEKKYRFLFDTGAPFSISRPLQDSFRFKLVSKGHIIDSDNNREKVNYVQVDTIRIASVPFVNQTAFVGDFKSNPVLACLDLDGIIGSNLMRHTNWKIDQMKQSLTLGDKIDHGKLTQENTVPFRTDRQYNILLDIGVGKSLVKDIKIDYGSNGPISLSDQVFSQLKEKKIVSETFYEYGFRQAGIVGKPVSLNRETTFTDSVKLNRIIVENVELRTGGDGLLGNKVLSDFLITIDWSNRNLYIDKNNDDSSSYETYGFRLGTSPDKGVFIQSVVENSTAYNNGIEPLSQVVKMGPLNFQMDDDYCDYVALMDQPPDTLTIEVIDSGGERKQLYIERKKIN